MREGATIGAGCRIGPGLEIGAFAMVGMGALVTTDVAPYSLVVGVPARHVGSFAAAASRCFGATPAPRPTPC